MACPRLASKGSPGTAPKGSEHQAPRTLSRRRSTADARDLAQDAFGDQPPATSVWVRKSVRKDGQQRYKELRVARHYVRFRVPGFRHSHRRHPLRGACILLAWRFGLPRRTVMQKQAAIRIGRGECWKKRSAAA